MCEDAQIQKSPRIFRWSTVGVASYLGWLVANAILAAIFPALLLLNAVGGDAGRFAIRRFGVWFLRLFFVRYLPLVGVYRIEEVSGLDRLASIDGCVLAANHRSWLDALLMLALIDRAVVPVNASYTKVPLIGTLMKWIGCLPLDRGSRDSVSTAVERIRDALSSGSRIVAFPEGRRYPVGRLGQFADLYFRLSIETGVPVVPVIIHSDLPYLGPGGKSLLTSRRAAWTIRILEAVLPEQTEKGADFARRVRKIVASELDLLDARASEQSRVSKP